MPNTIEDVLLRRTRIAFLDNMKVKAAIPYVAEALANYHGWSSDKKK
jgi:glycerol-3-phosphate dehydrogenase